MSLFGEIKRRNVFRVAMAYAVVSWLVIQVADAAVPALKLPEWVISLVFLLGALGFVPTLIFAWAFELTPEGIKLQKEVDRSQSITAETAFSKGSRWGGWSYNPEYEPIRNDPRLLALKKRNLDAINAERAQLGWEPVEEIGRFIAAE